MKVFYNLKKLCVIALFCSFIQPLQAVFLESGVACIEKTLAEIAIQADTHPAYPAQKAAMHALQTDFLLFFDQYQHDMVLSLFTGGHESYTDFLDCFKALSNQDGSFKKIKSHHIRNLIKKTNQVNVDLGVYINYLTITGLSDEKLKPLCLFKGLCERLVTEFFKEGYFLPTTKIEIYKDLFFHRLPEKMIEHKKKIAVVAAVALGIIFWRYWNNTDVIQKSNNPKLKPLLIKPGGVYAERDDVAKNIFYDAEKKQFRGRVKESFNAALTPQLDAYDIQICKVPKQKDNSSCGHRAVVTAAYAVKALRDGKDINQQLLNTAEEEKEFTTMLEAFFEKRDSEKWSDTDELKKTIEELPELKKELESQDVADVTIINSASDQNREDLTPKALLDDYLDCNECDISAHSIKRFQAGTPQFFVTYVPGRHWITIKVELKKNEATGTLKPLVTTYDGKHWDHNNEPIINTILYILTAGTAYETGTVKKQSDKQPLQLNQLTKEEIIEFIADGQKFSEEFKKEQREYKAACQSLGIPE